MYKRLSLLLPLFLLCILLTPSQQAFARFNSLPDLFGIGSDGPNTSSWPVDASATCTTVTVSLAYPAEENPIGSPDPYESVTWSLERVLVNGTQELSVVEADKTIHTFPYGTPAGYQGSKTFTLSTPLEAGTGLFIEVRYTVNGGELGGASGIFDVGDFDHPYWHIRAYDPAFSQNSPVSPEFGIDQQFCAGNTHAPNIYVLGDLVRNEGNGGLQTYQFKLFLDKPTDKPVRLDLESTTAAGLPAYNPPTPGFNGYSSRGIRFGSGVCIDSGNPDCIIPNYTTLIIPPGQTQVDLLVQIGSDTAPEHQIYWPHNFSIIRVANAKFGGIYSGILAARNDDGCNGYGPPDACFLTVFFPFGSSPEYPTDHYSFLVSNQVVDETAGSVTFTVTLTEAVDETVTIGYGTTSTGYNATANVDYTAVSGTLTFPPQTLSQQITVPIIVNPEAEGLEAFGLNVVKTGTVNSPDAVTVGALIINDYAAPPTDTPTMTPTKTPTDTPTGTIVGTEDVTPSKTPTSTPTLDPESVDLLINGDFEHVDTNGKPKLEPWTAKNDSNDKIKCNKPAKIFARTGQCAYMLRGDGNEATTLSQKVDLEVVDFAVNDVLTLNAYIDAKHTPTGKIKVIVKYADDSLDKSKIDLNLIQTSGYQLLTGDLSLQSSELDKIKVSIRHSASSGKVFVDSVQLIKSSTLPVLPLP
jgi:hypothetical protein